MPFLHLDSKGVPIPGKTFDAVDAAFRSARASVARVTVVKEDPPGSYVVLGHAGVGAVRALGKSGPNDYSIPRRHKKKESP